MYYPCKLVCTYVWVNECTLPASTVASIWVCVAGWFYGVSTLSQLLPIWTPVLLASAQAAAVRRLLHAAGLLTAAPQRVPVAGKVRVVCFDKTGTLTQHQLKFSGTATLIKNDGINQ